MEFEKIGDQVFIQDDYILKYNDLDHKTLSVSATLNLLSGKMILDRCEYKDEELPLQKLAEMEILRSVKQNYDNFIKELSGEIV